LTEVTSRSAVQDLADLHWLLDGHFRQLHGERSQLPAAAPVFALEHGLSDGDLSHLQEVVRSAVRQGLGAEFRRWWLPFAAYAAESGYSYAGGEYWQTFEEATPGWDASHRDLIRRWFTKFADDYGGARPQGAFAEYFPIIAWPITHAVLPVYLQRNLAKLLYGFHTGLTADLLEDPGALGERLAARADQYTERFRYFCQNTALLGQVSVALLSGEEEESPYLLQPTLHRLVAGLSAERESRQWLDGARASARRARARVSGLVPGPRPPGWAGQAAARLPATTDPRLVLRRAGRKWRAFAELPDLAPVLARLPQLADELRTRRARVAGAERPFLPARQLLYPGYEARLARWPQPGEQFISLERGTDAANRLIADQCVLAPGPSWLFRCQARGLAVEVKGKTARPGFSYVLVTGPQAEAPWLSWVTRVEIEAEGVRAFELTVPEIVTDGDAAALAAAGISLTSRVAVRPVGITASGWDGEGAVEWQAGEPAMIAIGTTQAPETCTVTLDGWRDTVPWPEGQRELLLMLGGLSAGTYDVSVALTAGGKDIADGFLLVTIRDPQDRPDGGSAGEGIRMLADPARPTLSELWDGRATVSVDGPDGEQASLTVTLLSEAGTTLAVIDRCCTLPLSPAGWSQIAAGIRSDARFRNAYDDAESAQVTVERAGTGLASLTCDRGFQPLRWRVTRVRGVASVARLADRTDGGCTTVDLFHVEDPLVPVPFPPVGDIPIPARGGLVRAASGTATAAVVLPTNPNEVMRLGSARPRVETRDRAPREVGRLATAWHWWDSADRPADPFAQHEVNTVLDAITSAIASLVARGGWAQAERNAQRGHHTAALLREMERCVGESPPDRALARAIAGHLRQWGTREQLRRGYPDLVAWSGALRVPATDPVTARFTLALADQPGLIITDWGQADRDELLCRILARPVLFRAARFAVLGARAVHQPLDQATIAGGAR
jgi:hypothetical protein